MILALVYIALMSSYIVYKVGTCVLLMDCV